MAGIAVLLCISSPDLYNNDLTYKTSLRIYPHPQAARGSITRNLRATMSGRKELRAQRFLSPGLG